MIIGSFIGQTVGGVERAILRVRKVEARVIKLKVGVKERVSSALADRYAALAEVKGDIETLTRLGQEV